MITGMPGGEQFERARFTSPSLAMHFLPIGLVGSCVLALELGVRRCRPRPGRNWPNQIPPQSGSASSAA